MALSFPLFGFDLSERKEAHVGSWRVEEGKEIDQQISCQFERTGDVVDGLHRVISHDERISHKRQVAVGAQFREAPNPCAAEVVSVDDEHERFLLHWNIAELLDLLH